MYQHDYLATYYPSAPVVEIEIGVTRTEPRVTVLALVDSGADGTIIPIHYLQQIGALPVGRKWMRGVRGAYDQVKLYNVFIQLGNYSLYASVVGDEVNDEAMIGRDVLNQFIVTLNGLASVVEITQ
jgi:predicted aspartyl protease